MKHSAIEKSIVFHEHYLDALFHLLLIPSLITREMICFKTLNWLVPEKYTRKYLKLISDKKKLGNSQLNTSTPFVILLYSDDIAENGLCRPNLLLERNSSTEAFRIIYHTWNQLFAAKINTFAVWHKMQVGTNQSEHFLWRVFKMLKYSLWRR